MAQISTPVAGIVMTIDCALGDYVKKGDILCSLTSNELMDIQQDFAETSARLGQLKADYERSKSLLNEKIGAEKDFQAIESEYKGMTAKYNALKIRLELVRLDVSEIREGKFVSSFPVVAPIEGFITEMNLLMGQYIEQQKGLMEITDVKQLQLQLSVFEEDITKLRTGQQVEFNLLGEPSLIHTATIISIGKAIDQDSRAIQCIAKISNENGVNFINRAYVEASVVTNQTEAKALPNEAILKSDNAHYVYVVEKSEKDTYYLRKEGINIGRISDGYTEIVDSEITAKILTKGIYNLQ
jgi:cobalt-zinc-cadmium efflux system membrane fusion protein